MDCIPVTAVQGLVKSLLTEAGAPKTLAARVVQLAGEIASVSGQVVAVRTEGGKRRIYVAHDVIIGAGGEVEKNVGLTGFDFPPNGNREESELLRAQDGGRVVSVIFKPDAQGLNVIQSVYVYAGKASSSPRY